MAIYDVGVKQLHTAWYTVEADSPEEAREIAERLSSRDTLNDSMNDMEYEGNLDSGQWDIKQLEE